MKSHIVMDLLLVLWCVLSAVISAFGSVTVSIHPGSPQLVHAGSSWTMVCTVTGKDFLSHAVTWRRLPRDSASTNQAKVIYGAGIAAKDPDTAKHYVGTFNINDTTGSVVVSIHIKTVELSDDGIYECRASKGAVIAGRTSIDLTVTELAVSLDGWRLTSPQALVTRGRGEVRYDVMEMRHGRNTAAAPALFLGGEPLAHTSEHTPLPGRDSLYSVAGSASVCLTPKQSGEELKVTAGGLTFTTNITVIDKPYLICGTSKRNTTVAVFCDSNFFWDDVLDFEMLYEPDNSGLDLSEPKVDGSEEHEHTEDVPVKMTLLYDVATFGRVPTNVVFNVSTEFGWLSQSVLLDRALDYGTKKTVAVEPSVFEEPCSVQPTKGREHLTKSSSKSNAAPAKTMTDRTQTCLLILAIVLTQSLFSFLKR